MPQVDLETLVSVLSRGSSDSKVACETLAATVDGDEAKPHDAVVTANVDVPESFWLSKDAEFDWFDRNAFFDRNHSTRSISSSINNHSNSNSQRFSKNLKTSKVAIIGLPKTQKPNYNLDLKRLHCKAAANVRLFPKRTPSVGKSPALMEPSSPKVSCMGRVRSTRGNKKQAGPAAEKKKPVATGKVKRNGFMSHLKSLFRSDRKSVRRSSSTRSRHDDKLNEQPDHEKRMNEKSVCCKPVSEPPPSLGGMARFASGRRTMSWGVEEVDAASHDDSLEFGRHEI